MVSSVKSNLHQHYDESFLFPQEKCNQYWPSNGHIKYGGIIVALDKIDKTADYITRTFQVEKVRKFPGFRSVYFKQGFPLKSLQTINAKISVFNSE